ncbi:hypothetical protein CK203_033885 [Vitis vinifera]|uniref:PXA domain-containing protein n=1 Tax=Vitis vinifera TaxID=29760 RepID=A0A438HU33_VITVI|nr:hypothetical protein CK203_033885 [Vitis vinifera]
MWLKALLHGNTQWVHRPQNVDMAIGRVLHPLWMPNPHLDHCHNHHVIGHLPFSSLIKQPAPAKLGSLRASINNLTQSKMENFLRVACNFLLFSFHDVELTILLLISVTSSSVWFNLPAAASLIIIIRYLSLDFEMRRKAAAYNSKPSSANTVSQKKSPEGPKIIEKFDWRRKVNSSVVEDAIDQFTRHLVSEWVTDLWYSRITPDKEGPEELVQIMNGVLGEISSRARNLFRAIQGKIVKKQLGSLSIADRDKELNLSWPQKTNCTLHYFLLRLSTRLSTLFCVLQIMLSQSVYRSHLKGEGFAAFDGWSHWFLPFKREDLQCSFFRYTVRELLACAVIRPVLNLANPRFINERIESLVISAAKANKGGTTAQEASQPKPNGSSRISSDHFSRFLDPSVTGVELVQLKNDQSRTAADKSGKDNVNGTHLSKDPLLSIDARSTRSWGSLPSGPLNW